MTIEELQKLTEQGDAKIVELDKKAAYVVVINMDVMTWENAKNIRPMFEDVAGVKVGVIGVLGKPKDAINIFKIEEAK